MMRICLPVKDVTSNRVILDVEHETLSRLFENVTVMDKTCRWYGLSKFKLKDLLRRLYCVGVYGLTFSCTALNDATNVSCTIIASTVKISSTTYVLDVLPVVYLDGVIDVRGKCISLVIDEAHASSDLLDNEHITFEIVDDLRVDLCQHEKCV